MGGFREGVVLVKQWDDYHTEMCVGFRRLCINFDFSSFLQVFFYNYLHICHDAPSKDVSVAVEDFLKAVDSEY